MTLSSEWVLDQGYSLEPARRMGGGGQQGLNNTNTQDAEGGGDRVWVGVACSVVGNLCISVSFQLQRLAHKNNTAGVPYTQIKTWWIGMLLMVCGEVGNFMAYGMYYAHTHTHTHTYTHTQA